MIEVNHRVNTESMQLGTSHICLSDGCESAAMRPLLQAIWMMRTCYRSIHAAGNLTHRHGGGSQRRAQEPDVVHLVGGDLRGVGLSENATVQF